MSRISWTLMLVGATAGIAAFYPVVKALEGTIDPTLLAFFRFSIASAALLPVMIYSRLLRMPRMHDIPLLVFISACIVVPTIFVVIGVAHTNSVVAAILINTNPLIITLLSPLLIVEKITNRKRIALLVGLLGVVSVVLNGRSPFELFDSSYTGGALILLIAALASGLNKIYAKQLVRAYDGLSVTFFSTVIGAVGLLIINMFTDTFSDAARFGVNEMAAVLCIGVLSTAIPWTIWNSSLKHLDVHVAASFMLLVPIFAAFFSFLFLHETFTGWMLAGLVLTSIGIYAVQREERTVAT
jgi:drug/metabolite transporter (DMT)-like permease